MPSPLVAAAGIDAPSATSSPGDARSTARGSPVPLAGHRSLTSGLPDLRSILRLAAMWLLVSSWRSRIEGTWHESGVSQLLASPGLSWV